MDNKHIDNTTEANSEGILNNCSPLNVSRVTDNFHYSEKDFNKLVNDFKVEKYSLLHDQLSDSEDFASIPYKSIDNNNEKQQDKMCELASTSHENDVNVSESKSQELTDTKLDDGKIVRMHRSSLSTAFPIMNILSSKSGPHICLDCCFKCSTIFRVLDSPLHIRCIRSINKKNEFLKIEPSLLVDSCLCGFCWKYLEKTYRSNKLKNRKEEKSRLLEGYVKKKLSKNQNQARRCSVHLCSLPYSHKMSVNECEHLKKLFLTFEFCQLVFVQSRKQTRDSLKFPICLCKIHNAMILVMSTCQICGGKLNAPFNPDDWSMHKMWNLALVENNLPLILKPAMFICVTCKGHINKKKPGFPTIELPRLREYILINNEIRLKLYGESQNNLINICQGSTYVSSAIVVPKIQEEKKCVRSTKVKFSDPLITTDYNFGIGYHKNNTESITSTALLNVAEQNLCTNKLESKDKGFIAAVEPPNVIINPVLRKRKESNVICDIISNKDGKKQKLNEKYSSHDNNSTDDNATKSYRNKNIAHPSINSPNLSIDVDEDIELNTNVPSIHTEKDYSLDLSYVDNDPDMLLYLKEKLQLLYNKELVVSETADEFSKDYLKEQKTTLYKCFGDTKDSINASKPFIHPSSHLLQYSKRLSTDNIEPLIIKDITTTTSLSTQSNSIASPKKNVATNEGVGSKFNNIRTTKILPLCNLVSKSKNNIISTNSESKVPNHLLTYINPLLNSCIPYLSDDNYPFTEIDLQQLINNDVHFPVSIKKKD